MSESLGFDPVSEALGVQESIAQAEQEGLCLPLLKGGLELDVEGARLSPSKETGELARHVGPLQGSTPLVSEVNADLKLSTPVET